ncbi:hypothetical protein HN709_03875 [Candidatus Peregrinibacteria bacterium]|jgi:hypothetical protein|nr:hypothetical protein [Candidatus Peregrinibacteria bacterium]MBT7736804.1 hypothetical protein [Candidatus Peregrinibacteria bacterium]
MQCNFKDDNGKQCRAHSIKGQECCFFHHSEKKKRQEAQSRGGQAKTIVVKEPLPPMTLKETQDVILLLEDTINRVRSGELDAKIGNCIGVLSGQLIKAIEVSSIANRVEIIERAILERRTTF